MDTRQPAELATRVDPAALQIIKGALRSAQLAMERDFLSALRKPSPSPLAGEGWGGGAARTISPQISR
jgi:hypothetical protein